MGVAMFLKTMAKKPVIKQAVGVAKEVVNTKLDPIKSLLSGESNTSKENVGIGQILGGAQQADAGKPTTDALKNLESSVQSMMSVDTGFYGHNKVKGMKQDSSGFYKQKNVSQKLF